MSTLEKLVSSLQVTDATSDRVAAAKQSTSQITDLELRSISEFLVETGMWFMAKNAGGGEDEQKHDAKRIQRLMGERSNEDLEPVFAAVFGGLSAEVANAWQSLRRLPFDTILYGIPARCPRLSSATLQLRFLWLCELAKVVYRFPAGLVTPEWLAVHGAGLKLESGANEMLRLFGLARSGAAEQDVVGRFLGCVIATESSSGENVYETLALIAQGKHPVGEVGSYVYRALWGSNQDRAHDLLIDLLRCSQEPDQIESIVCSATDGGRRRSQRYCESRWRLSF
ncbi:hypothetical protein [Stieleria mannarensis]|uniref:hypothetical protein n=1 Tax=Stieleria mannarensis TaxID=2755585 RepID=UPI001603E2A9|nr:hypothetical protein [Rhodopirellula sp. JC639]